MPRKISILLWLSVIYATISCSWAQTTINIPLGYSTNGYAKKTPQSPTNITTFGTTSNSDDYLPSIKGELSVSDVGALNYVLPIEVEKGVNSFQPNISLTYNSQSGNGMAGWGWNITGLSMITIGGKSKAIDGMTIGAQNDGSDPFYLDGQRLVPGAESNTFVTQKFSTIKVTKDFSTDYPFIVQFPDGKISKYKNLQSNGNYYISTISDALGNEIHYTYTLIADLTNNGIVTRYVPYLEKISYGGKDITTDKYYIKFNYANRNTPLTAYSRGINYVTDKVLSKITVGYMDASSAERTYSLIYDHIQNNTTERLVGIQLYNKAGNPLPNGLTFDYNGVQSQGNATLNIDGAIKIPYYTTGLGAVTSGYYSNFSSQENTPIYQIKAGASYELNNHINLGAIKNDADTKLFSGKILSASNTVTQDDQLIIVNEQYTGTVATYGSQDLQSLHDYLIFNIKDLQTGGVTEIKTEVKSGYNQKNMGAKNSPQSFRDESKRKFLQGDFNNDGLTDFLVIENENLARKNRIYFLDIGNQNKSATVDATVLYEGTEKFYDKEIYPVELDGDGLPELMVVDRVKFSYSVYKIDLLKSKITLFNSLQNITLSNFTKNTPLFFGDFNGDGLTDFITPNKVYEIPSNDNGDGSDMAQKYQQMESEKLLWKMYTATGTQYLVSDKDFTAQKIAYLKSAQNNNISESSWWDKFWNGKPDNYNYTRYATHNIIVTDFNNDGKSDIIIFNKIGKAVYNNNGTIAYLLVDDLPNIANSSIVNSISFFENTTNNNVQTFSALTSAKTSIEKIPFSPFSLILPKIDFDKLNVSNVGLFIHDPILARNIKLTIDNSNFLEKEIQQVDNGSGIVQKIEYRNMIDRLGSYRGDGPNAGEVTYIYQPQLNLEYPFYVHRKNPSVYLVGKIHTLFNNNTQILTKEYRYQNAIQNFDGKGYIGFQKCFSSDAYESEKIGTGAAAAIRIKHPTTTVLWTILTKDPFYDNAVVSSTYGGLANFLTTTTTNYQKFAKLGVGQKQELTLATDVFSVDDLKKINSSKKYIYDDNNGYKLKTVYTNFNDIGSSVSSYEYENANNPNASAPFFDGKITKNSTTIYKDGLSFSTLDVTSYDAANGLPKSVTKYNDDNSQSIKTSYVYDKYGNVTKKTVTDNANTISLTTAYNYDNSNRFVTSTTTPDGLTTKADYDATGKVTKEVSPLGYTKLYSYDNWGNVINTSSSLADPDLASTPAPLTVTIETKKIGTIDQSIPTGAVYYIHKTPLGSSESYTYYDVFDRVVMTKTQTLKDFVCSQIQYDILGNKIAYSEPYFYDDGKGKPTLWTKTVYDDLNRPILTTTFTGKKISSCYEGTTVTVDDGYQQSSKTIDAMGHTIRAQDNGGVINYRYFPNGTLRETDYEGIKNTFTIDGWGNKTSQIDPSIGTYTYEYDILGRLTKETNPKSTQTINTYNDKGLIEKVTITIKNDPDKVISYTDYSYNALNLPIKISGVNKSSLSFSYETQYGDYSRPIKQVETTPDFIITTTTTYDDNKYGRVDKVDKTTTNNSTVNLPTFNSTTTIINGYDATTGILIKQFDGTNTKLIWELNEINAWGKTTKMTYANGYTINNTYDPNNATLTEIKHEKTATSKTFFDFKYTYDIDKGVLTKRESQYYDNNNSKQIDRTEDFVYDELNRLTKETTKENVISSANISLNYTYDNRGRMTSNDQLGLYNFNSADYLLQNIKLNISGIVVNKNRGFVAATYNELRYTEKLTLPSTEELNFEYNILEGRYSIADDKNGTITTKYYSADYSVEIIKNSSTNTAKLITYITGSPYGANYIKIEPLTSSGIGTAKNYYLHRDQIGSIVGITDATGAMVEQRFFDAWGNLKVWVDASGTATTDADVNNNWSSTNLLIDRGYTGHEHLWQAGLINMNARMYDPVLRRFLSADDVLPDLFSTQDYNRFGYGRNNPLLYIDPDGHCPFLIVVAIAAAVSVTANGINNIINGVPFWYGMGKSAVVGAVSGAISFGIGAVASSAFGEALSFGKAAFEAGMHGITGGLISQADGGNFGSGFFSGMVSSAIASGVNALGIDFSHSTEKSTAYNSFGKDYMQAAMIAAGGLSGGISATIAGGNFWDGLRQGIITSALNHVAHLAEGDKDQPNPKPKQKWHKMNVDKKLYPGIDFYKNDNLKDYDAVTLPGIGIFIGGGVNGDRETRLMQHEYGHYLDYKHSPDLNFDGKGLFNFYLSIGVSSIFNMATGIGGNHSFYWTELRANNYAYMWFGNNLAPDFTIRYPLEPKK
ncbi:RHS repeat-associated core domain-containing protein [Parasediminibacterium sp. JCM 36343]|uniref:RHS repeat-associated core domain-containing protein n=1 Tax=Parasediminibacterium sp. JCM 36343 TaxID=3374279 RepID=UPI0039796DDA